MITFSDLFQLKKVEKDATVFKYLCTFVLLKKE